MQFRHFSRLCLSSFKWAWAEEPHLSLSVGSATLAHEHHTLVSWELVVWVRWKFGLGNISLTDNTGLVRRMLMTAGGDPPQKPNACPHDRATHAQPSGIRS